MLAFSQIGPSPSSPDHPEGAFMVWHVDLESVRALEAIDFQPYFGLGCDLSGGRSTAPA